jgi:hypothetical protein
LGPYFFVCSFLLQFHYPKLQVAQLGASGSTPSAAAASRITLFDKQACCMFSCPVQSNHLFLNGMSCQDFWSMDWFGECHRDVIL